MLNVSSRSTTIFLVAVKRKYQTDRRTLKEGDEFRIRRVKKAKYDQRKIRVHLFCKPLLNFTIHIRLTTKDKVWLLPMSFNFNQIQNDFMFDESDSSDFEGITNFHGDQKVSHYSIHGYTCTMCVIVLELNLWMDELDKRYVCKLEK